MDELNILLIILINKLCYKIMKMITLLGDKEKTNSFVFGETIMRLGVLRVLI